MVPPQLKSNGARRERGSWFETCEPEPRTLDYVGTSPDNKMKRIEDYALLGDLQTAALVHREGSVDWCCFPRFDSGACFAALLGEAEHGRWKIAPATEILRTERC